MPVLILVLLCLTALPALAQEPPLPDVAQLVREVRANVRTDDQLLRQYTFLERRQDVKATKLGKLYLGPRREFEVYPSQVPGETYKRLISVDGKPLPAAELARRDEAHRQGVLSRLAQLEAETPDQKRKRLAKLAKERREEDLVIDDVFAVYDIKVLRREMVDGRPTIVTSLTPRPGVKTRSDAGGYLKKLRGFAWVDEADRQVARIEMEAISDVTMGLGLLARLHKGSTLLFRRTRVNGEIWLPAEARFRIAGRTVIFRKFALESTTQYSAYRKFEVTTTETVK